MLETKNINIGDKFGYWTVIELPIKENSRCKIKCVCKCGNTKYVEKYNLLKGKSKSCGCLKAELAKERMTTHGESDTRLYYIYTSMKERCLNPNNQAYKDYGGRGIKIHNEWLNSFENFRDWSLDNGYSDNLTIDRIDVNGNYEPNNCRWITMKAQCNNRRSNITINLNGETKTLTEICEEYQLDYKKILPRYNKMKPNESIEDILFTENKHDVYITYMEETHTIKEWSDITGIATTVISARRLKGFYEEDIFYKGNLSTKYKGETIPKKKEIVKPMF